MKKYVAFRIQNTECRSQNKKFRSLISDLRSAFRILLILIIAGFVSCTNTNQPKEKTAEEKKPEVPVPAFNADSAYSFVKKQTDFGPRVCNTPAHDKCAAYLEAKMHSYGAKVTVQETQVKAFNGKMLKIKNIIGSYNPSAGNRILILSHWDSRPWADHDPDPANRDKPIDGANDGASGVGVILELARQFSLSAPSVGVDLLLTDAEDYGPQENVMKNEDTSDWWGLGTQYWAKHPHTPDYTAKYGILLDMVGAPNATFLMEAISMSFAASVVKGIWTVGNNIGYSNYFIFEQGSPITDDHLFINRILNLPTIDIIHLDRTSQTSFGSYWHTLKDNIDLVDRNTLKAVGQTLMTVIYREE
jgi:Zn-dependent M28 family amino/carboxypeptidase